MTCIVGVQEHGNVYLGGDSAGVSDHNLRIRKDSKVFSVGSILFGFTSSFRMGQLLRFSLKIPEQTTPDDYKYLCTSLIDAIRKCFKKGGYVGTEKSGQELGGDFLIGYKGQLYHVCSDFQVGIPELSYDACGCGEPYALGSLYATEGLELGSPERIRRALEAAAKFSGAVAPPFHIISSVVCGKEFSSKKKKLD